MFQKCYLERVLEKFEMSESRTVSTPMLSHTKFTRDGADGVASQRVDVPYRHVIGSLLYAALATRPDLSYCTALLSRYSESPTLVHWTALKRVLQYLIGKTHYGISCVKREGIDVVACSDADYAGCLDTRKSTSGHLIQLCGTPVIWRSTKQSIVATSTCATEYLAASQICHDIVWLRGMLKELVRVELSPTPLLIDNLGAVKVIQNNQTTEKTKHLADKFSDIKDCHEQKVVRVQYVPTDKQLADVFTKSLPQDKLHNMLCHVGLVQITVLVILAFAQVD